MAPKTILILGEYPALNGGENSLLAILPQLQSQGCQFQALVPAGSEFSSALAQIDIPTHDFRPGSGPTRKTQTEIRSAIAAKIQHVQPDLVHANSLSMGRLLGPVSAELGISSLGYLRDIIGLSKKAVSDINQLDRIVAVSNATREFHIAQGMNPDRIATVHNGVDLNQFHPADDSTDRDAIRRELEIPSDSKLILCIGQIGLRKAVDVTLATFAELHAQNQKLHLAIVGIRHSQKAEAIEYEKHLRQTAASIPGHIHWLGRRSDIPQLMRGADLLLHAARQEPLGRVLLEASASGLPIVATNVGGTDEILGRSVDFPHDLNLTCEKDNPEQLTAAAGRILGSDTTHQSISQRLRESAEIRFTIRRSAQQLLENYQTCWTD